MKSGIKDKLIFLGIAVLMSVTGCATTVDLQVQRPPALNTLGIRRLAVMPFSTTGSSSLQRQAAAYLTNESLTRIQATNHFTMVNAAQVEQARGTGNIENLADALFSGQVISAGSQDSSQSNSRTAKDKDGKTVTVNYTTYTRTVQVSFNYGLTRTRDGSMVGPLSKTLSDSRSSEDSSNLPSAESMIQNLIQRSMAGVGRDVAPYTATESRSFMKETSKNKAVKQRAKNADAMIKAGNYKTAQDAFLKIYQDTGSFPAAFNTALLIEIQGDPEGASAFLQNVYNDTGNLQAAAEIARLQKVMDDAGLLQTYRVNQTQRDKVIALMTDTLPAKLPDRARVSLINNSQNERDITEAVINGITEGFLKKSITVIDRNTRALVEMEKAYQLSGNVSDAEMVSIGREAGVNAFVLVSVTGSGGTRRLLVRVLDVERNTVLYQSPQTDEMNL
jgi:TolB-like protein